MNLRKSKNRAFGGVEIGKEEEEEDKNFVFISDCGIEYWWCLSAREETVVVDQAW
jgi:hypothetical protein